eukprot:Rmarinus@m.17218
MDLINLSATASPSCIPIGKTTTVKVLLEVETKAIDGNPVPPMSLGCVLDTSSSMSGTPIEYCRQALCDVADKLRLNDEFHLAVYGSTSRPVFESKTARDRTEVKKTIQNVGVSGCTNMVAGISTGYGQLCGKDLERQVFDCPPEAEPDTNHVTTSRRRRSSIMGSVTPWLSSLFNRSSSAVERPDTIMQHRDSKLRRMFLFSDGKVNTGITDRGKITKLVEEAAASGDVSVSAFGVGSHYDEHLMLAIAKAGKGDYYYIKDADEIQRIIGVAFNNLERTFGIEAVIRSNVLNTAACTLKMIHGVPAGQTDSPVGDLNAEDVSLVYLEMEITPAKGYSVGDEIDILSFALDWLHLPADKQKFTKEAAPVRVKVVATDATDLMEESVDVAVEEYSNLMKIAQGETNVDATLNCENDYVEMERKRCQFRSELNDACLKMDALETANGGVHAKKALRVKKMAAGMQKFNERTITSLQTRSKSACSKALQHEEYTWQAKSASRYY